MTRWYLDTSAAVKLLNVEAESDALARTIDDAQPTLVGCWLLETELRRVVQRSVGISHAAVSHLLDGVELFEVPRSLYREAGLLPGAALRSLDALHLSAALRIGAEHVLTYDTRMAAAAESIGLRVLAPAA